MKAMVLEALGLDNLKLKEVPDPRPGPGEVLVRIRAASLNFRDLLVVDGRYGSRQRSSNLIPLSDGAGDVLEVGPGVRAWKPGDRVVGAFFPDWLSGPPNELLMRRDIGGMEDGVACELRVFRSDALAAVPSSLSYVEAATLPCAAVTAWNAVRTHGNVGPEHAVLTQGSGGVALFALQFARAAGARVIATTSTAEKAQRLSTLGARHTINYRDDPEWGKTVRGICPRGVDLVVETGGAGTLKQSMRAVKNGGMITLIGVVSGTTAELNLPVASMNSMKLHGIAVGNRDQLQEVLAAMDTNDIRPVIDRVYPLEALPEALRHLQSGQQFGKVCIEIP